MEDSLLPICIFLSFASLPFGIRFKYILLGGQVPINTLTATCFIDVLFIVGLTYFLGQRIGLVMICFVFYPLSAITHFLLLSRFLGKDDVISVVVPGVIPVCIYFAGCVGYFFLSFLKMG